MCLSRTNVTECVAICIFRSQSGQQSAELDVPVPRRQRRAGVITAPSLRLRPVHGATTPAASTVQHQAPSFPHLQQQWFQPHRCQLQSRAGVESSDSRGSATSKRGRRRWHEVLMIKSLCLNGNPPQSYTSMSIDSYMEQTENDSVFTVTETVRTMAQDLNCIQRVLRVFKVYQQQSPKVKV